MNSLKLTKINLLVNPLRHLMVNVTGSSTMYQIMNGLSACLRYSLTILPASVKFYTVN